MALANEEGQRQSALLDYLAAGWQGLECLECCCAFVPAAVGFGVLGWALARRRSLPWRHSGGG